MPYILILFGIILIIVNTKAINKKENSFSHVLKYKKEDISEVQTEIAQIRKDVAESLTEMQQEILELKEIIKKNELSTNENKVVKSNNNNIEATDKKSIIMKLIKEGYTEEEICNKLSLGKGEVLLVKSLFKE